MTEEELKAIEKDTQKHIRHEARENSFIHALARVENSVRKGWDDTQGLWFPHKSLEGGADTIAYGHKLHTRETFARGITEFEAFKLFHDDLDWARRNGAYCSWNDTFPNEDILEVEPTTQQQGLLILTDIVFNVGSLLKNGVWQWPKLAQAIIDGNQQGMYEESIRSYVDTNGNRVPLKQRSIDICRAIGLEFTP